MDRAIDDGAGDFLAGEVVLVDGVVVGEEVDDCFVELLAGENLLGCGNEVIQHFRFER